MVLLLFSLIVAILVGFIVAYLASLREVRRMREENVSLKVALGEVAATEKEKEKGYQEKIALLTESKEKLKEAFKLLSLEAVEKISEKSEAEMLKREEVFKKSLDPVKEGLNKLSEGMFKIEKERRGEQEALKEHLKAVLDSEKSLRDETANLVKALRKPDVRGMWGELQLRRVIELSGMVNHCDFVEQSVTSSEEGRMRPDVIIHLPGDKQIIIDAKVPFEAFLEANHTENPELKEQKLRDHSRHVRQHMQQLGKKSYWQSFPQTPEFVVLFLPAEIFFSAALQYDPSLIEVGADQGVIIATPTTLIGLLKAIAYGWKQDKFSRHAQEISDLGHELYKRVSDMSKHLSLLGRSLTNAVEGYNKAMGSFERRVLVSARKFKDLGAGSGEIELEPIELIDKIPKNL